MKKIKLRALIIFLIITLAIIIGIFISLNTKSLLVEDKNLAVYNSGAYCQNNKECMTSGCSGEICGGGATSVCFRPYGFWKQFNGRECRCINNICKWSKPR